MPTDLTEVSQFTANVPTPDDGEDVDAASVIQFAQPLADRTKFLRAGLPEYAWVGRRVVYAPGDGTVRVGPCGGVVLGGVLLTYGAETNLGSGGRASNTWFYVYAYDDAGTLTMVEDTVAPVASLAFKSGDVTRRYVGCFRTNGSGVPVPMRYVDGHCTYRRSACPEVSDPLQVLDVGQLTSYADVALASCVPPHAYIARLRARALWAANLVVLSLRTKGDTTASVRISGNDEVWADVDVETNSTQQIQYQVNNASAEGYLEVWGFRE